MGPQKIRADLHVNGDNRKLVLATIENETTEHLGLKLAAYLLFWKEELVVLPSLKHPALIGQAFRPDLMATNIEGSVSVWVECGNTSLHKLGKVLRKWPQARVVVFKDQPVQAENFRRSLKGVVPKPERVEVFGWPAGGFKNWMNCLSEKTDVIGDAADVSFNLVVNGEVYLEDLKRY
jgi:hypothetical protein